MKQSPILILLRALSKGDPIDKPLPKDWPAEKRERVLWHLCSHHDLSGFALRQLSIIDPEETWISRANLREFEKKRRKKLLLQYRAASQLTTQLIASGIPVGVFKGPDLSKRLFNDLGLRSAKDFDFVINQDSFPKAMKIVGSLANDLDIRLASANAAGFSQLFRSQKDISFQLKDDCMIELHARPLYLGRLSNLIQWTRGGDGMERMPLADAMFYSLCHGQVASWVRLKWALDAKLLAMTATKEDWQRVKNLSEIGACKNSIARALSWLDEIWGTEFLIHFGHSKPSLYLGRNSAGLHRALDRFDARMNHLDSIFFTTAPLDWLRNIRNLFFNPGLILLEGGGPLGLVAKSVTFIVKSSVQRLVSYLQRGTP